MSADFTAFQEKFRVAELTVYKNASWTWSVRSGQPTVGCGVLSLNRYALELGDVSKSEMESFAEIVSRLEKTIKSTFDYQIMNYLALMMVDRHTHFHVIPRFDGPRSFVGKTWVDNGWPALPVMTDAQHSGDDSILFAMRDELRSHLAD